MSIQTLPDPRDTAAASRTWFWTPTPSERNAFVCFRRDLSVTAAPEEAVLRIAADARYRLRVNGTTVACGPLRFVPAHPCEDRHDLRPWLRVGANAVTVEVWSPGSSTFQTMPEARGGFAPAGTVISSGRRDDLGTGWRARACAAWDVEAPAFSFAQGPIEICDTAALPEAWFLPGDAGAGWSEPQAVAGGPWGAITPRGLPDLALTIDAPGTLSLAARLADDEQRLGCRVFHAGFTRRAAGPKPRFPYAVCIHSSKDQTVAVGLFWGPHWLNGESLPAKNDPLRGNRQNADLVLRAGWNLLYGEPEVLTQSWCMNLAWPKAAGLRFAAEASEGPTAMRYADCDEPTAMPSARKAVPAKPADLAGLGLAWRTARATDTDTTPLPSRDCAWDQPGEILARDAAAAFPQALSGGTVLVYDFHREFLGTVTIEIEAPAGTIVDVANDERLRTDGLLGLYATNPFTDTADRFVCRGGRQTIEGFHPRGGRWLQIHVRPPGLKSPVILHRVAITSAQVPVVRDGRFESSEPIFDWSFETGLATLRACVEDAFLDCPWRERGTYLGDALVEQSALASVTRDLRVARRSLELWAQGQLPDGQMQACVPSWHRRPHEDFSLWWIPAVRDYWALSGDLAFVKQYRGVIDRILESPAWKTEDASLWTAVGLHIFIDWGATKGAHTGRGNACLNAIRILAREAAAELCDAVGDAVAAKAHRVEATKVRDDLAARLWNAAEGRFAAHLGSDGVRDDAESARHANVLCLLADVVDGERKAAAWAWLEAQLATNLADGCGKGQASGHCELYFLYYVLRLCYRDGKVLLAERIMREHWGLLMRRGAWTMWECFCRGFMGGGSQCHAWSCGPLAFLREQVLGVTWAPGVDDRVRVAPNSLLTWAKGEVPHPRGVIAVHWRRQAGKVFLEVAAPSGVAVETGLGVALADHRLV